MSITPIEATAIELGPRGLQLLLEHISDWAEREIGRTVGAHMIGFGSGPVVGEESSNGDMEVVAAALRGSKAWETLLRSGEPVDIDVRDLPDLPAPITSVRSVPFAGEIEPRGLLLLACDGEGPSSVEIAEALEPIEPVVRSVVNHALLQLEADQLRSQLHEPVETAIGVTMVALGVSAFEARRALDVAAGREGRPVQAVADDVIEYAAETGRVRELLLD